MTLHKPSLLAEEPASPPVRTPRQRPVPPRKGMVREVAAIVRELWETRDLLFQLTRRDITIRYKQAVMGFAWAILTPMLIVLSGLLIRLAMARFAGATVAMSSMAGITVKSLPWAFFVAAIGFATPSLSGNMNLVTKIYFPREVLTISAVLANLKDLGVGLLVVACGLPFMGVRYGFTVLWVPILLLLLIGITTASGIFLACANLFLRDVKYIVQILLTFGIFFTPVFFETTLLGERGAKLAMLNPLAPVLEGMRLAVVDGHNLIRPLIHAGPHGGPDILVWSPWYLVYSGLWATLGLSLSLLFFRRLSYLFAEYI
jgi:lipopolysaccharide transport system permease protein